MPNSVPIKKRSPSTAPALGRPRGAYVHVPFCSRRCGYCNFTLITGRDDLVDPYLDALEAELSHVLGSPQPVKTLFLGGGTPSYLTGRAMERLLRLLAHWLPLESDGEFSCEANPLDCSDAQLQQLVSGGVNRISLGGQSFHDRKLRMLERDHCGSHLHEAIERCAAAIENLSLDLIFAAPGETLDEWNADLDRAIASPIQHLSCYGLTVERGAAYYARIQKNELSEVDADTQLAMYSLAIDNLTASKWEHYEVSNFALPGFRCRHNEGYWLGAPWWAFGPGAAAFLPSNHVRPWRSGVELDSADTMVRTVNHRSTTSYIRKVRAGESPIAEHEVLLPEQELRERLVFGLRRMEGVRLDKLEQWYGSPVQPLFEPFLSNYVQRGWLEFAGDHLRLTHAGLVISDSMWPDLLSDL